MTADVHFAEAGSLKDKRTHMRRMRDHLTRRHGATFAEVGYQDLWQRSQIVFAIAASDPRVLETKVTEALAYLDAQEWDVVGLREEVVEVDA